MRTKSLPIGFEDYRDIIDGNYYYVDKTSIIRELRDSGGKVNLFLRPRRFGKTLTLSMLKYFYEDAGRAEENAARRALFNGMKIMSEPASYREGMTAFPVISLTLKSAKQGTFQEAYSALKESIAAEFERHNAVFGEIANEANSTLWKRIMAREGGRDDYNTSLLFLSRRLYEAYGKRVVILIDEYDVLLESAYFNGYYNEMISFIRSLFESALKTNPYLEFAVITGCLRVSRESIFTGLNNLLVMSVLDNYFGEHYGFTQDEVDEMLHYYDRESRREDLRRWYNGYRIGGKNVYNPWSVVNSARGIAKVEGCPLGLYWANTSSNDIIKTLIEESGPRERSELETLLSGGTLTKPIREDITYADLTRAGDNLWNFMLFTGYLTAEAVRQDGVNIIAELVIPNSEVRSIYENKIREWFDDKVRQKDLSGFYKAVVAGDAPAVEERLREILQETISYYDYAENYYHGVLTGVLSGMKTHIARSNRESGRGRPDITLTPPSRRGTIVIIEIKVCSTYADMEREAQAALSQIERQDYESEYRAEGFMSFARYGVAFYKKDVIVRTMSPQ
ncbi:MAG: ATP-binding protein [Clostridiales bacterium]|nr:ATP-binding protein [Clostridiales bacterium]